MQHLISTDKLFTLGSCPARHRSRLLSPYCVGLCRFLAEETAGVYQVDGQGFFRPDGSLLLAEE